MHGCSVVSLLPCFVPCPEVRTVTKAPFMIIYYTLNVCSGCYIHEHT